MPRSARPLMADVRASCQRARQTADVRANSEIGADGEQQAWPSPIRAREWVDPGGRRWHMRGGTLDQRHLRRLLKRLDVRVLHVYGPEPREVSFQNLESLLAGIDEFFRGQAAPTTDFRVADFRDSDHHVLVVVEESC
jgi:hypothetical protein